MDQETAPLLGNPLIRAVKGSAWLALREAELGVIDSELVRFSEPEAPPPGSSDITAVPVLPVLLRLVAVIRTVWALLIVGGAT